MRDAAARGEPLALVYGFERAGQYCGRWVITKVHEGRTDFFQNGAPRKIEFSLQLEAYGDDSDFNSSASVSLALPVPGLMGSLGLADNLLASAGTIAGLPSITTSAANLPSAVSALGNLGTTASTMFSNALKALTGAAQVIEAGNVTGAAQASAQLRAAAQQGIQLVKDTQRAVAVVQASASDVKGLSSSMATGMKAVLKDAVVNGGIVQAAAVVCGAKPHTADMGDAQRLQYGAALSNAQRAADSIIFTAGEAARQASELAGKIEV